MTSGMLVTVVGVLFLFLLLGGMKVPFAVGIAATSYLFGLTGIAGLKAIGLVAWSSTNSFVLTSIPLFVFMSEILLHSGLSRKVYDGLTNIVRKLPGGLLQTNIAGCAVFAAISGSSVATAAAIGTIALPSLKERGYNVRMSVGSLAAGGTLGILIPPSIAMIIYGTFTETSIAKLFMAGVVPGLIVSGMFMLYIGLRCKLQPHLTPREAGAMTLAVMIETIIDLTPFVLLIGLVLGSLYFGLATPTEAAAVGSALSLIIAAVTGRLTWEVLSKSLFSTIVTAGSILFIVMSAFIFSYAITIGGLAQNFALWIGSLGLTKYQILFAITIMYTVLGCLLESMAMIVITVPLLFPVLVATGIDPLWFGVILVLLIEGGQVSPPFGINLFVIQSLAKGNYEDVVMGTIPYHLILLFGIVLFAAFPELVTWLPSQITAR